MHPGEITAPVLVDGGYWILKVRERLADEVTPFDQVKDRIQEELTRTRFEKVYGDYIADLKKNAVYTVYVREAPTRIGRAKTRPKAPVAPSDDEFTTSGSTTPERITAPSNPNKPAPTPTPEAR